MKKNDNSKLEIRILKGCEAKDKTALLKVLADTAAGMKYAQEANLSSEKVLELLMKREAENPTELGEGLFFPHTRIKQFGGLSVVLAALPQTLGCDAGFAAPVRVVCMMLIPEETPMEALKFMSRVAGCMQSHDCNKHFCRILNDGDLTKLDALLDLDSRKVICASDLMRDCHCSLTPEMRLQDATRMMLAEDVQIVPVLNKDGKLVGELSCPELFKLGIPDFFTQLKSVGFIRYFDPFENYFAKEAASLVSDVMKTSVPKFPADATLIEIVFAMAVEKIQLIYIVDADGKLLGVIDQTVLLERIINL
ncbi:MAG: CBS domain-containing protein [Victivallaceae bacterium]